VTEPDRIYGTENREKGKRKIGWAQAVYPLRARLQELKEMNLHPARWDDTLEDELTGLRTGEQAFMAIRPKLIRAGYTTLDSILRIQKESGIRFFCPPLKGVDSKTQESATRWIQMLHKFPAHLHALDIKDAHTQREPGIEKLAGMKTSKLADKYIAKRNKMRNQCTLLRSQGVEGKLLYLDKMEEIIRACDKLLPTWKTHGSPLGDRKVKEIMYQTITKMADELEQWRDDPNTGDTLTSLILIELSLDEIRVMDFAILVVEEEAATEFPSILKLLIKKSRISGNNPQIRQWWYEVMSTRPPPLPKNEDRYREEILDHIEEGWQGEELAINMSQIIHEILHQNLDLEWDTRTEDVALSLDAIKRCLTNMLGALDRDTPQMQGGLTFPLTCTTQD